MGKGGQDCAKLHAKIATCQPPPYRDLARLFLCPPQVLNDKWVSVPTGSEDFSFKNMRKNQYEEALFRCEDERYEIDMVVDNNAIRCLEPLNSEIQALKAADGFEWQFRLDRRAIGVIHLKAIARIYGDHGNEVLELLRKNPAGGIPIILKVHFRSAVPAMRLATFNRYHAM